MSPPPSEPGLSLFGAMWSYMDRRDRDGWAQHQYRHLERQLHGVRESMFGCMNQGTPATLVEFDRHVRILTAHLHFVRQYLHAVCERDSAA